MNTHIEQTKETDEVWKIVHAKGVDWNVSNKARVSVPGHITLFMRVRKGKRQSMAHTSKGGILAQCMTKSGYLEVAHMRNGKRIKMSVHRLVGFAFVKGFEPGLSINHINGIKTDNSVENLEWVSLSQNTKHQWQTGLTKVDSPKLTSKQVVYMRKLYNQGIPGHTIDIIAGVTPGYTQMICKGRRRTNVFDMVISHASPSSDQQSKTRQ